MKKQDEIDVKKIRQAAEQQIDEVNRLAKKEVDKALKKQGQFLLTTKQP